MIAGAVVVGLLIGLFPGVVLGYRKGYREGREYKIVNQTAVGKPWTNMVNDHASLTREP